MHRYVSGHGANGYILQIDIKKYFDSINHAVLKEMVHKKIHESEEIMNLIDYIIDTSSATDKGLNLGSEAPQIFAIYYLSGIDNYIKTVKSMKYYGRYMDDMFIISEDKEQLKALLADIKDQLAKLKLEVNERKTHITKLTHGFTFLQIKYSIDGNRIIKRPTHSKIVRERRRLKKFKALYEQGNMTEFDIHNCYKSWRNGLMKDCNRCGRTIREMDKLYERLFPEHEEHRKMTREEIIRQAYKELAENGDLDLIPLTY